MFPHLKDFLVYFYALYQRSSYLTIKQNHWRAFFKKITGYKTTPQTVMIQLVWMGPRSLYF